MNKKGDIANKESGNSYTETAENKVMQNNYNDTENLYKDT